MKYVLICHHHFYYLYAWENHNRSIQWTETSRHWAPLVDRLQQNQARSVRIVDGLTTHILKTESPHRALRSYEFLWWAWHKWRMYTQQSGLAFVCFHWVSAFQSLIVAKSPTAIGLSHVTQGAKDKGLVVHMNSYPLSLALALWPYVAMKNVDNSHQMIVMAVDHNRTVVLAFYHKKNLIYVKYPIYTSESDTGVQAKNSVHDTIRHVEKMTSLRFQSPVIVAENPDHLPWLTTLWPHYATHSASSLWNDYGQNNASPPGTQANLFDHMVVGHVSKRSRWRFGRECSHRAIEDKSRLGSVWMRLSLWGALLAALFFLVNGVYQTYSLHQDHQQWKAKMTHLEWQINTHPVSYNVMESMHTIQLSVAEQTDRLYRYLTLLLHVLHDQYRLKALFIHEDKVRLTLRPITPYAHSESLMETAQSAGLSLIKDEAAGPSSHLHFQSTPSPLHTLFPLHDDKKRSV